jgi:tRNA(fMet)-specific endonuclease VapC
VKKVILDTNAYVTLPAGKGDVLDAISAAETVYMSVFVLGELYAGFIGGTRERENKETLQRFLLKPTVKIPNASSETAEVFVPVKSNLGKTDTLYPSTMSGLPPTASSPVRWLSPMTRTSRELRVYPCGRGFSMHHIIPKLWVMYP